MKRYFPKNAEDASALILTLLVIVLLSTIVTSFLSSTRTEQTATRNYTSKTQAEQFATMATQQAMATLQSAFNGNGTGTAIVVSQPGAIGKYFGASGGNLTGNKTDLFFTASSTNANGTVNMNNLSGPNSTVNTSGLSITGNVSENITVYSVDVKDSGNKTIIGRIAYYVDDEGTKVNLNSASSNRSTLNVGNARPLSLFGANLSANMTTFDSIVSGNNTGSSNIKTWSAFFRPEQAIGAGVFTGNAALALASISTTAPSGGNSTLTTTPWGTSRIYINTLSTNATDGTGDASVRSIYEAFTGKNATTGASSNSTYGATGQVLSKIYGGDFSTKYTDIGVKQIAANMLQMRDPNTSNVTNSFNYNGPLLGSSNLNSSIPQEYLGFAPYPVVSEVSMDVTYSNPPPYFRPYVRVNVELYNPYPVTFNNANATLEFCMRGLTWNMTHTINSTGESFGPYRYGGYGNWTDNSSSIEHWSQSYKRDNAKNNKQFSEAFFSTHTPYGIQGLTIPAYSKVKYNLTGPFWGTYGQALTNSIFPFDQNDIKITSMTDVRCAITYIKIVGNSTIANGLGGATNINPNTVRDWVLGADVGPFIPNDGNLSLNSYSNISFPRNAGTHETFWTADPISKYSYQRLCPLLKTSMAASANLTNSTRSWTTNASAANQTFNNTTSASAITTATQTEQYNDSNANPGYDSGNAIPSDPSYSNYNGNAVYANATLTYDMREPVLPTGNYTCPADLGLVPTNQRWRRLRMQPQPSSESTAGYIPDWAILDVVAFGQNGTSANYTFTPVNPNGKFNVASGTPPAPRTSGLKALVQMLDTTSTNATLADPMNSSGNVTVNKIRFMGNNSSTATAAIVAGNIANMTWSTNSTWSTRRNARNFPSTCLLLPSEVCEIKGVADVVSQGNYANTTEHFKWNEGRVSAIIPGLTTCSSFFTIYAYAESGRELNGAFVPDSYHLTKTLVEVKNNSGNYTVKSVYNQSIPME